MIFSGMDVILIVKSLAEIIQRRIEDYTYV